CSGCSSAAQMANHLAVKLDREGLAEMSCIAGVGGNVRPLVRLAQSGRPILALDGCALQCVKHSLAERGVAPAAHVLLHELGAKKRFHTDFDPDQAQALYGQVAEAARNLHPASALAEPAQEAEAAS
ncbi:MAG: putative zinc-binding protein, partial [Noviherbaspirillum sp.]